MTNPNEPRHTILNRAELPGALRAFAELYIGPFGEAEFRGWPHAEASVWALGAEPTAFFKVFKQPRKFVQERRAYREWLPHLDATPNLLGESETHSALLVSAVPGKNVDDVFLTSEETLTTYRQAGTFLQRLHTLPFEDDNLVPLLEDYRRRAKTWLARAEGLLEPDLIAWVTERAAEAAELLEEMNPARVPCHRDYTARNWLVDVTDGLNLSVVDFEHSRPDFWLFDTERIYAKIGGTPLESAFWQGYGHALSDIEKRLLETHGSLIALSTSLWAIEHGDKAYEVENRARLNELRKVASRSFLLMNR